jgi:arylsulfatase A
MKTPSCLLAALLAAFTAVPAVQSAPAPGATQPPNVILILADDLGYETIGANGGTSYRTPALDRLATTGARFTHCYAQPLCTPTRVQLMTGQSNARNYINFGTMDPSLTTFAHLFKRAGYVTGIAGKWQLGRALDLPKTLGFDEHCLWQHTRRPPRYANPGLEINGVERDYTNGEYGPDLVHDFVRDFVARHRERPFFLYYPMMLTHSPYQATPDSQTWNPQAQGEQVNVRPEHFGDMVTYMDKLVGKLVAQLDTLGLRERTLLLFLGDNGTGAGTRSMRGATEVIGAKGKTIRTGMNVPLIVNWPGKVVAGTVCPDLVDTTDFLPTMCAAANVTVPAGLTLDGRSFLPQLQGEKGRPREWLYSWYSPRQSSDLSVREFAFNQRYKLYASGSFFDLERDPLEQQPLPVAGLSGDAAAAARKFQAAITGFAGVRPARLDQLAADNTADKAPRKKKAGKK